jgi:hypothetical protein
MAERERRDLRGPVKTVTSESFDWDEKAAAVPEKPNRREELTFSLQGKLLESISQFQDRLIQRCTYVYDDAGRLREIKYRNSDGTESSMQVKYDQYGQRIRYSSNVTYSTENGRKIKTEVFEAKVPGVDRTIGFEEEGPSLVSWNTGNAALASTFYNAAGRPTEIVLYDDEHMQISKIVRKYDECGRVASEENQALSPRVFAGQRGAQGKVMPNDMAQLFTRIFSQGPMRMIYKYDDQDRVIEQTQEMGLFGYDKTVSSYNEHGDLSKHKHYSARRGDIPVDEVGNFLAPPPASEKLESETEFSYQYDDRGNWTRKKTSMLYHPKSRWESVEKRSITYHFESH